MGVQPLRGSPKYIYGSLFISIFNLIHIIFINELVKLQTNNRLIHSDIESNGSQKNILSCKGVDKQLSLRNPGLKHSIK